MRKVTVCIFSLVLVLTFGGLVFGGGAREEAPTNLVYMTAGDVNMLALGQHVLGPQFEADHPNYSVMTIHTGPGNAGSQRILEKLLAERDAGREKWDVDVAMVHEIFMTWAMEEDLLQSYATELDTWQYVTSPFAKSALGADIEGYAMPMFHSQTALAYNPEYVDDPPASFEELVLWVQDNPGKFGYNGIKGGMSGVAFTTAWVYWQTGAYEKYTSGPFEQSEVDAWEAVYEELADFNEYVTITAGNVGTLDALNRGEIWMGPVWVDMFFTFMDEGKLDPNMRLALPEPGLPGQPMYFVIPRQARNPEAARDFVEMVTSPTVQAKDIVQRFNWYPGIDGSYIEGKVPQEVFDTIYRDVSPADLARKSQAFPLADYFSAVVESYERWID